MSTEAKEPTSAYLSLRAELLLEEVALMFTEPAWLKKTYADELGKQKERFLRDAEKAFDRVVHKRAVFSTAEEITKCAGCGKALPGQAPGVICKVCDDADGAGR